jgi:hypothetical protein
MCASQHFFGPARASWTVGSKHAQSAQERCSPQCALHYAQTLYSTVTTSTLSGINFILMRYTQQLMKAATLEDFQTASASIQLACYPHNHKYERATETNSGGMISI